MNLFEFAYFPRFEDNLNALANRLALSETWGYSNPEGFVNVLSIFKICFGVANVRP